MSLRSFPISVSQYLRRLLADGLLVAAGHVDLAKEPAYG